ncbi:hypothetical protein BC937DRAFT_88458 [Endogone sp. FLAS-F59071]|nr:hypothetical protein BC937DRAFT_88458 [Endogone sp. FLAS-F59071]|eukprot:RUS18684.1 hypothetical protein BC937DRAFT_88458 [Endogone sp. FLAS-F59071]
MEAQSRFRRSQSPSVALAGASSAIKTAAINPIIIQSSVPIHTSFETTKADTLQVPPTLSVHNIEDHDHHDHHNHGHHGHDDHDHDHHQQFKSYDPRTHQHHAHLHDSHAHAHHQPHAHSHAHDSHSHSHDSHGHSHDAHSHDAHSHDAHDLHEHGHSHAHDHAHDHSHAAHLHAQTATQARPLPSTMSVLASLAPMQKTLFTWATVHVLTGLTVWYVGQGANSLAMAGFAYVVIFDAFGVFNIFISSVIASNREFRESNLKRSYGAQRYEVVFALATTIYLLFAAMYTTKESIEHMMLEEAGEKAGAPHEESGSIGFGSIVMILVAVGVTLVSSVGFQNHRNFAQILRTNTTTYGVTYSTLYPQRPSAVTLILNNTFTLATLGCAASILLSALFDRAASVGSQSDHHAGYADKLAAFAESFVMFYLGGPTAAAIAKVLLQTAPDSVSGGLEMRLREVQQDPSVLSIDRAHFWQNTYGQYVGTLEVRAHPEANEQAVMQLVHQKLEGVLSVSGGGAMGQQAAMMMSNGGYGAKAAVGAEAGAGELTVQVTKG